MPEPKRARAMEAQVWLSGRIEQWLVTDAGSRTGIFSGFNPPGVARAHSLRPLEAHKAVYVPLFEANQNATPLTPMKNQRISFGYQGAIKADF